VDDVVIVGAGPAGAVAGLVLARAGARVRIVDRATFPRDKLCGDTLNPGALARLHALGIAGPIETRGLPVDGMILTGERGVSVEGRYPPAQSGRAIMRRDLDWALLQAAIAAGCQFDPGVTVRGPIVLTSRLPGTQLAVDSRSSRSELGIESNPTRDGLGPGGESRARIAGVRVGTSAGGMAMAAPITIAADGRRSTIAFGLGLARHPAPRRWAIGAYFENFASAGAADPRRRRAAGSCDRPTESVAAAPVLGEMHVRRGRYIGVAPVPGGLTNVCLVRPSGPGDPQLADARALLTRELARDPLLADRAAAARLVAPPVVLGPLAVDVRPTALDGLLIAGDAAGFIDPMTGDGLRFAIRGGELAAGAALDVLAHGWSGVHARLAAVRAREFGAKWRFNRALRAVVGSSPAVDAAALAARVAPAAFRALIARAGDCAAAC